MVLKKKGTAAPLPFASPSLPAMPKKGQKVKHKKALCYLSESKKIFFIIMDPPNNASEFRQPTGSAKADDSRRRAKDVDEVKEF